VEEWLHSVGLYGAIVGAGLVAALTAIRLRWLLAVGASLTAVVVASVLWDVAWADESDFYDIGREGALILGLVFAGGALALFAASAYVGRLVRRSVCRSRARREAPQDDPTRG
jgi:hypothetical protein